MSKVRITALASLFVLPLVLALALPAFAVQTGKLTGTVFDPDGVPLGGVVVTITSPEMMGTRKIQTSDDGGFLFFGLPPGKYQVEINQAGFMSFRQEEIKVGIGLTVTLDILLELPTAEETVVITARRPAVDKEKTVLGQNYDDEFLQTVPMTRDYQTVATLAAGVVGGGNPNIHGGTLYDNQYLVDGINTTDPYLNTFSANFNFDAIKEVQVLTGGLDAEYGQARGGIINLVTKSGGNDFHVDASFYLRPDMFVLKDDFEKEGAAVFNHYQGNINVGGPILKDRLWYFVSVELDKAISTLSATKNYFDEADPEPFQHPERDWSSVYYLAKLTFQATEAHKLTFMSTGNPTWIKNQEQNIFVASEAESQRFQGGEFFTIAWEALWSKSLFQKTQVALSHQVLDQYPMGCRDNYNENCRGRQDQTLGISTGNSTLDYLSERYRIQFDSSWTYYLDNFVGSHEFKAGWQFHHAWVNFEQGLPGGAYYSDRNGRPYRIVQLKEVDGKLDRLNTTITGDTLGMYVQDAWKITKNLIVKPGVRFDIAQMRNFDGDVITEFFTTSPRLNIVWDITGDGKTVARVGANRYVSTGFLYIADFVGKGLEQDEYEYNPATGQYDIFVRTIGSSSNVVVKEDLTAPHTDEVTLGFERELFADFSLAVSGLWRESNNYFEDDEANLIWDQAGQNVIGYKSSEESYVWSLGTPKEAWSRYWGLEVVATKAISNNWQLNASYTYSRAQGAPDSPITSYLDNPRQNEYYWSWMGHDVRHRMKIDGSYKLPYGVQIGTSIFWTTGAPYTKIVFNNYWNGYNNYDYKRGYDRTRPDDEYWNRYPDRVGFDFKLVWDLKELTGQQIDLIAEMFNIFHLRDKTGMNTVDYANGTPLRYEEYTQHRAGFNAALGLRYRY